MTVVNLRQARKARDRAAKDTRAAANRAAFGRTKAEKLADLEVAAKVGRTLDGAKRER